MKTSAARAASPDKRKGRDATSQPFQNFHQHSKDADSTNHLQVQFLRDHLAVSMSIAGTVASLIWGTRHG